MDPVKPRIRRECFLTIGATADFPQLLAAAVAEPTLQKLRDLGFTNLTLQVGELADYFLRIKPDDSKGINIRHFAFNKNGLQDEMRKCQAKPGVSEEGVVVCHAGKLLCLIFRTSRQNDTDFLKGLAPF